MSITREAYLHLLNKKDIAKKPSKYHNIITTVDNIKFASKKESERYLNLKFLEKKGLIKDLKLQPKFSFPMDFAYKADFSYIDVKTNKLVIEDTKGVKDKLFILKEKCFRYFYPDLDLRVIQ